MVGISRLIVVAMSCAALIAGLSACSLADELGLSSSGPGESAPATGAESAGPSVYYTASADLPLYREPGTSTIRRLPQYTKVVRDGLERGYAHVRVDETGEEGWLDNARLIWRLPSASTPPTPTPGEPPTPAPSAQAAPEPEIPQASVESPPAEPAMPPAAAPSATTSPQARTTVPPAVFQPF